MTTSRTEWIFGIPKCDYKGCGIIFNSNNELWNHMDNEHLFKAPTKKKLVQKETFKGEQYPVSRIQKNSKGEIYLDLSEMGLDVSQLSSILTSINEHDMNKS